MRHGVQYRVQLSTIYHRKRERFFALLDRLGKACALIAGTAVFSKLLLEDFKAYAGLFVAVVTLLSLVFSWADKARLHNELAQKFFQVQAAIAAAGERGFTEEQINLWKSQIHLIEVGEPPTLSGLVQLCQNQLAIAARDKDAFFPMKWWKRWFVHFFDMPISANIFSEKKAITQTGLEDH